ncbi:MAG: DNA-3-methyladenine glycosylase I, partial [Actinobacteria bacterium]|nr:DNA-3-methyladenine glycosylase I [Actinomycetota bacterium]
MAKTDDDFSLVVGEDGLARPAWAAADPLMREYYDTEWGMPVRDERSVFERLSLEVFQAGLSWGTILRKREAFRAAFEGFDPDVVAAYGPDDVERLMADATIVRNHRKILATITNAQATVALRDADDVADGLAGLFWSFQPDATPAPKTGAEVPSETEESAALAKE